MRHLASLLLAPSVLLVAASLVGPAPRLRAADTILAGRWTLDKDQSEFPDEMGFDMQVETAAQGTTSANSGRSRVPRVGTAAPALTIAHEGEQTLKILGDVTDEAEHPWPVLTIDEADGVVTITDWRRPRWPSSAVPPGQRRRAAAGRWRDHHPHEVGQERTRHRLHGGEGPRRAVHVLAPPGRGDARGRSELPRPWQR